MNRTDRIDMRVLRLAAVLLPSGLLMHEAVYALAGSGDRASHGYLAFALPLIAALAVSVGLASLLLPLLGAAPARRSAGLAPLALAGALVAIFAVQELSEALVLGGGVADLVSALAAAWLLAPLALLFGLLAAAGVHWLDLIGEALWELLRFRDRSAKPRATGSTAPRPPLFARLDPLAFGLARRPPPACPR